MSTTARHRTPHLADAADILHWSERVEARTEFPRLIRRLIQEDNDQVVRIDMRAAEGAGVPGFDGIVEASRASAFVPNGLSFWELGTGADVQAKASSDFRKRTDALGEGVKSDAVLVCVTSRRWPGKAEWQNAKGAEDRWRGVRAVDVDDIEQALENATAIHVWVSEMVGKAAYGAQSLEYWWNGFAGRTNPPLTEAIVLAGREDTASDILRFLAQDRRFTTIGSASVDDGLASVAAAVLTTEEDTQSRLLSRMLVVRDVEFLRRLDGASSLVLLAPGEEPFRREAESLQGQHVVFLSDLDSPADIPLPSIGAEQFAQGLSEAGVPKEDAERFSRAAHRSLRKFQRLAATTGAPQVPEWSNQLRTKTVRMAWLAGGWNSGKSGDIDVLTGLLGRDYRDATDELWQAGRGADPLFTHVGGTWAVDSPEDSWNHARSHINSSDLERLEAAIQSVLGAVDPALELPVEERWKASIYGRARVHSSTIREGLATTLALFGCSGNSLDLGGGSTARAWAEEVVFSLLDRANADPTGQLWSSLADVLPLLAEAAPDVFLQAVQIGLEGPNPVLGKLFIDEKDAFSISSPHTGLLWALETTAWSSQHFGLTSELLARLAEVDPGGRLSNRPQASLADIFRPWLPQTSASTSSRSNVLKALVARHPEIGTNLLFGLLPEHHAVGLFTHKPRFRSWRRDDEKMSPQGFWEFSSDVVEQILGVAQREPARWSDVAARLSDFPPPGREAAYSLLEELSAQSLPDDVRSEVWESLGKQLRHHRAYPEAGWSLPAAELDRLGKALEAIRPRNPIDRHKWLFAEQLPDVGSARKNDFCAYDAEVSHLRSAAVAEIQKGAGLSGVLKLASQLDRAWPLGVALAENAELVDSLDVVRLLGSDDPKHVDFAFGFVVKSSHGRLEPILPFVDALTGHPQAQARLLATSDELPAAWEAAQRFGEEVDESYWKEFQAGGRGADFTHVNDAARHLIEHGRPAAALDLLALYRDQTQDPVNYGLVVSAFEALLSSVDDEMGTLSSWKIERLLEFLRCSPMDEQELAVLEWRLLPAITFDASAPILERQIARDPAFFVEILSLCFNPESKDATSNTDPHVAQNAFRLLTNWKQIPGSDEPGGSVDENRLSDWFAEARRLLGEADRQAVGASQIGQVFAHDRVDDDGTWPTRPIRDIIEETGSASLERGLYVGTRNKRGGTSRGLTEGGDQERELALDFDQWAEAVADEWPRTAAVLRSLADSYRTEGRSHDEDARRFTEGLGR